MMKKTIFFIGILLQFFGCNSDKYICEEYNGKMEEYYNSPEKINFNLIDINGLKTKEISYDNLVKILGKEVNRRASEFKGDSFTYYHFNLNGNNVVYREYNNTFQINTIVLNNEKVNIQIDNLKLNGNTSEKEIKDYNLRMYCNRVHFVEEGRKQFFLVGIDTKQTLTLEFIKGKLKTLTFLE